MTQPPENNPNSEKKGTDSGLRADSFVRQSTAPLARGSQPLMDPELGEDFFERQQREKQAAAKDTRPFNQASLRAFTEGTVAKAEVLIGSLEARVELLMRSCQLANKPVPGVESTEYRHTVTPNTQKILAYLTRAIQVKPALLQRVQVAVFRFHEAVQVIGRVRASLAEAELEPGLLEELKLKFYYLQNYHEEFKIDPVLTQVFPPPQAPTRSGSAGPLKPASGQLSPAEVALQRQALEATFHQAQAVVAELAGHLAFFAKGMEAADQNKTGHLGSLFSDAATKRLQAFAKVVKADPMLMVKLKGDRKLYDELLARIKVAYQTGQHEVLGESLEAFLRLRASWMQHAALKEFMAPSEAGAKKKP